MIPSMSASLSLRGILTESAPTLIKTKTWEREAEHAVIWMRSATPSIPAKTREAAKRITY
jgi:hypothetical protein